MSAPHTSFSTARHLADQRFCFVVLLLLTLLAVVERVHGIDRQSLWSDELYAVMASYRPSFSDIWPLLTHDSHPPGYVALMYFILPMLDYSDVAIRLPSLVFGILWVPLVYWIGRRWISCEAGLIAATLVASAHSAIYFSQEARAYAMLIVFSLTSIICFLEILFTAQPHRGYVWGYIASSVMVLYLHYTGFVFFAAQGLLYLLFWASGYRRGNWREILQCGGIPLLVYAPWLGLMLNHLTDTSLNWAVSGKPTLDYVYYTFQRLWGPEDSLTRIYLYALVLALLLALWQHLRQSAHQTAGVIYTLVFLLVVPVLAFYIESIIWTPIFEKRYFLVSLPLVILLLAYLGSSALHALVSSQWQKPLLVAGLALLTGWMVHSNIDKQLYTEKTKDPVREAVQAIATDLKQSPAEDYTVIMTFNWFEHYLRRAYISYDKSWESRIYYAPQQIGNISGYLDSRPHINRFYYLSLRDPNSDAATNALRLRYKLLSKASLTVPSGAIDIYQFSAKQAPDTNTVEVSKDRFNDVARWVADHARNKKPGSYTTLITHDWMEPYVVHNRISLDRDWSDRYYYRDTQLDDVGLYLAQHPGISHFYYLWLDTPDLQVAFTLLQLNYALLTEHSMETPVGRVNISEFSLQGDVRRHSIDKTPLEKLSAYQGAKQFVQSLQGQDSDRFRILTSRHFIEVYLRANGASIDTKWPERHYFIDQQAEGLFTYLGRHPEITQLYYLFLREEQTERAANILRSRYALVSRSSFDSDHGTVDVYRLDTTRRPSDINEVKQQLNGYPLFHVARWAARDAAQTPKKYATLITHDFFQPYLDLHELKVDRSWRDRFVSQPSQAEIALDWLKSHPEVDHAYYFAIADGNTQHTIDLLIRKSHVHCQRTVKSANLGKVMVMKLDVKGAPVSRVADCAD